MTTPFLFHLSDGSNESIHSDGEGGSLPPLESESSSASLNTYRNVIAAESEASIYDRIRILENQHFYNIPPQNNPREYENLVRQHFDQALDVDHYMEIWDREYQEVLFLEKKAFLQDKLHDLMLNEHNLDRIMDLSPYSDVRKEAYHFIQDRFPPLNINSLEYPLRLQQRYIMDENLNSINFFVTDLERNHSRSEFYQQFYRVFTDEEFRRANGLGGGVFLQRSSFLPEWCQSIGV